MKRTKPLRQRTALRRSPMRRGAKRSKYARRERHWDFMSFVRGLLCSVEEDRPDPDHDPTPCSGEIEADHAGRRGIGQKADDRTCIPMCSGHHRERTDHSWSFKHLNQEQLRAWIARQILRTTTLWTERR